MKREDLFEAIGGVAEERLELSERSYKKHAVWIRYGSIAAGVCLVMLAAVVIPTVVKRGMKNSDILSGDSMQESSYEEGEEMAETDADNAAVAEGQKDAFDMESTLEDAETDNAQNMAEHTEAGNAQDAAEDTGAGDTQVTANSGRKEDVIAEEGGFTLAFADGDTGDAVYCPISNELRQSFGLPENVQLTKADLGEYMGTVEDCEDETLKGCKVYYSAIYPEDEGICIVDRNGSYEIYYSE